MAFEIEVNEGQGKIFENHSTNPKAPQWKGKLRLEGVEYSIAIWDRTSEKGNRSFSFKVERGR